MEQNTALDQLSWRLNQPRKSSFDMKSSHISSGLFLIFYLCRLRLLSFDPGCLQYFACMHIFCAKRIFWLGERDLQPTSITPFVPQITLLRQGTSDLVSHVNWSFMTGDTGFKFGKHFASSCQGFTMEASITNLLTDHISRHRSIL